MPRDNPQRGEMPPHRKDKAARQQEAQSDARPNPGDKEDGRGRDAGRDGSDSNR